MTASPEVLQLALAMQQAGCSLIPIKQDKKPVLKWKILQSERASAQQLQAWAASPLTTGFATVCGKVSGGLEVLDFDDPAVFPLYMEALPGWAKETAFPIQRTGGGGYQLIYRRPNPAKNTKLAWRREADEEGIPEKKSQARIETRGEGGYALIPHSLHPSGNRYTLQAGDWSIIPAITEEQAEELWALARPFDQRRYNNTTQRGLRMPVRGLTTTDALGRYIEQAIEKELAALRATPRGGRNDQLNKATFCLAQFVGAGVLDETEVAASLHQAAQDSGMTEAEDGISATIKSGMEAGKAHPRDLTHVGMGKRVNGSPPTRHEDQGVPNKTLEAEGHLPEIVVNTQRLRDIAEQAVDALLKQNSPPRLFKRAGELGRLMHQEGEMRFKPFDPVALKSELERSANFVKEVTREGITSLSPARPPLDLAPDLLARTDLLPFPTLRMLTTRPVYSRAGDLVAVPGYHPESGIFLTLDKAEFLTLPRSEQALALLRELLHDFPFAHRAGFAHTLGALLVPFIRPLIDGPTPLHLIEAPTRGTGKSLLAEVIPAVALGASAGVMVQPKNGEEFDKRVTSLLLEGSRVILLDNVHTLKGEVLAAALTARTWRGRRLGKSEMLTLPNDALWLATGNNVVLDDDMPRRIVPIRLDAGVELPEERAGFRHPDLRGWIKVNQTELMAACLTLIEQWKAAGQPAGTATLGSYESWSAKVGGVLQVAGVEGFLEGREHLYEISNPETEDWGHVLELVYVAHENQPVPAKVFLEVMVMTGTFIDLWEGRTPLVQRQKVGHALLACRDRVFSGRCLRVAGKDVTTKNRLYRVEIVKSVRVDSQTSEKRREDEIVPADTSGVQGVSGVSSEPPAPDEIDREEF